MVAPIEGPCHSTALRSLRWMLWRATSFDVHCEWLHSCRGCHVSNALADVAPDHRSAWWLVGVRKRADQQGMKHDKHALMWTGRRTHMPLLGGRPLDVNSRIVAESIKLTLTLQIYGLSVALNHFGDSRIQVLCPILFTHFTASWILLSFVPHTGMTKTDCKLQSIDIVIYGIFCRIDFNSDKIYTI